MKKIGLLGSTGSIGVQTLDVIRAHKSSFQLVTMSFGKNIEKGLAQINEFQPYIVSVETKEIADQIAHQLPSHVKLVYGAEGIIEVATYHKMDLLVNAVMGSVGLKPTLAAIESRIDVAIANKETLVTAGHLVTQLAEKMGVELIPVDSEHSAIYQCLEGNIEKEVSRIILTASGGSFRDRSIEELKTVTIEDALNHPNWNMGAKITIDSATMMNKGLEVIEAKWLFNIPYEKIDVILHKESIIHSMVEYIDGSVLAHLGSPDMRVPIQYALTKPERLDMYEGKKLNLWELGALHFQQVDYERFRCLHLAYEAGKIGGTAPTVLNAANEIAVSLFLQGKITFLQIEEIVEKALMMHRTSNSPSLEEIVSVDKDTREKILSYIS
ncbi:1-deoxy-D-xylulose-5-phosphate reductoisomerase [Evansella cellulosilytica]|uniref:1-deoxy-D-xylulose 5-phosphate reductoisomerase n=1 Tax=Evansella cellulosilytica (strain ATCC 21833 / DSM 2522 / FERM P-1141 / JCM 9156 / N-4) TaxID=649639 RepID=E6TSS9_EVAC2|nr:1-deoxy-D-xylulose-5-phosphate reductoisomerase [Evansella cellulosilytica]ADU30721.1 1-deoxy-D-xylulose 5-phosphate reductoisomerase [Evansella cellulosilytica DSM 2522]